MTIFFLLLLVMMVIDDDSADRSFIDTYDDDTDDVITNQLFTLIAIQQ